MNPWILLVGGLALLYFGAQGFVRGGAGLALRLGLTPLVVGLTVIAYGTSSPELLVGVEAALHGNGGISVGNVVGSNISNIALILGVCALMKPLAASGQVVRREIPLMIGATLLATVLLWDGRLGRLEGAILLGAAVAYTAATVRQARKQAAADAGRERSGARPMSLGLALVLVGGGLGLLTAGANFFVSGAVRVAEAWGLSETVIGLTVVAVGTSLPELATSLVAGWRGESDVAMGNVVGSNLCNLLGILGVVALVRPLAAPDLARADLGLMLALSVVLLPLARSGNRINRLEGAGLLAAYIGYTAWLVSRAG